MRVPSDDPQTPSAKGKILLLILLMVRYSDYCLSVAVSPIYVSKPHTGSVTIGNQDRHSGRPTQAAARHHIRVLFSVNIDDINDPRAVDDIIDAGYSVVV
ncbi:hypothetical protein PENNAL_c0004G07991 [Penicillium nalgiovense]|uniref:Uncharacterized protein n=1 Tax=Penicillium nalgiovense TaxID=60175 RepID=A0A1V6Z3N2_PENNA|nr:hypothetical protein PENNAL_c0004G07991 [Penicillium nalgiovense]